MVVRNKAMVSEENKVNEVVVSNENKVNEVLIGYDNKIDEDMINYGIGMQYCVHIHLINKGDTLYKLSRQYDVKLTDIMRLNPYINVYNLNVGDELLIPVADKKVI